MNYIKQTLMLVLFLVTFSLSAETKLTTESVTQMINGIQKTVLAQDAEKFAAFFTDDAKINIEMPANMGGVMNLDKPKYINMLKLGWAAKDVEYTYEVKNIEIKISANGKNATVKDLTLETIKVGGKIIASSKSEETLKVIVSEGVPKIINLYGKVTFL